MLKVKIPEPETGLRLQLDQARLDITTRSRTSRLPWRGQFSPEFIEYLMNEICPAAEVFYDPFCGSGTVLFEAIQRSKSAFGAEVNPAAWHLAALSSFSMLSHTEQAQITLDVRNVMNSTISQGTFSETKLYLNVLNSLKDESEHPFFRLALAAIVLLAMGNGLKLDNNALGRSSISIISILEELSTTSGKASCFLADARQSPLKSGSVDAVITSPPYINVFNYHQNYRLAAELIGWRPLQAASSEIGANRKHRQNRFLTVVQYCLDMAGCVAETARVMKSGKLLIMVLGRTSNVLGASFKNGDIISEIIESTEAFHPLEKAERSFTNRFGERIYEDIIIALRNENFAKIQEDEVRKIGIRALHRAETAVPEKNRAALFNAIDKAGMVGPSPLLSISVPATFAGPLVKRAI